MYLYKSVVLTSAFVTFMSELRSICICNCSVYIYTCEPVGTRARCGVPMTLTVILRHFDCKVVLLFCLTLRILSLTMCVHIAQACARYHLLTQRTHAWTNDCCQRFFCSIFALDHAFLSLERKVISSFKCMTRQREISHRALSTYDFCYSIICLD